MNARAFSGLFEVEPCEFDLVANRLVVRDSEVAFEFSGSDGDGEFHIEGAVALVTPSSSASTRLPYRYTGWKDTYFASIAIEYIRITEGRCQLRARWEQDGESWAFFGELAPHGT